MRPLVFEKDPSFWYETLRVLGHIAYGGADFGEVAVTVERVAEGDRDGWHDAWRATADRVAAEARRSHAAGHRVSAHDAFLRASTYHRSAGFFLHGDTAGPHGDSAGPRADSAGPRADAAHDEAVACFRAAAELSDLDIRPVEIPYGSTTLPGYLYRAGDGPGPVVVMHNGFDGSAEEMHFFAAEAMVRRGYHVLTFDGPGQPGPMRREGLVFRPDWENVVGPVLDFLLDRPAGEAIADPGRVALLGASMGGLLASRAAAFEPRIAALIAFDGVYDMGWKVTAVFDGDREAARAALALPEADDAMAALMAADPVTRWAVVHGMRVMGASTPRGYAAALLDYHLRDGVAERITCPTLVCSAAGDFAFAGQPEALYEHLTCDKTFAEFTAEEGADAHCQSGAQRLAMARIGDWLDTTFGSMR